MADGVTPPPQYHAGAQEQRTFGQFLDEWVAYYMAIGMPWEDIMYGSPWAFDDYDKAYEYRLMQQNQSNHMQGYYHYLAISSALSSAFAGKGKKGTPYPTYPTPVTNTEREAEKRRNIEKTLAWVRGRKKDVKR